MTIYEKRFDRNLIHWNRSVEYNRQFIRMLIQYFNDKLRFQGYVFLKDIYEYLGIPLTRDSIIVGWVFKPDKPTIDIEFEQINDTDFMLRFKTDGIILTYFD